MEAKKRLGYVDLTKLWAIFCVVWGHSIYMSWDGGNASAHPIFNFVTSFNMPLFMILSGIFASSTLKSSFIDLLKSKALQILVPPLLWLVLQVFVYSSIWGRGLNVANLLKYGQMLADRYWFMPSIFICFLLYYLSSKVLVNVNWGRFLSPLLSWLIALVLIKVYPYSQKWNLDHMVPYFFLGSYLKPLLKSDKPLKKLTWGLISLFIGLLLFWRIDYSLYYVYIDLLRTGLDWENIGLNVYQMVTGIVGSLSFILLFRMLERDGIRFVNRLASYGKETLGIYMLNYIVLDMIYIIFRRVPAVKEVSDVITPWLADFLVFAPIAILCTAICLVIIRQIRRSHGLARLLLGS